MNINSDINILGGLPDWNLVRVFWSERVLYESDENIHEYTSIKTQGSVRRFARAIRGTFLRFKDPKIEELFRDLIESERLSTDTLLFMFWNAAVNNDLIRYLSDHAYFPAFFSGRVTLKRVEVEACIDDLKLTETDLQDWTSETIKTTASKYITLLCKFGLMRGTTSKEIFHPHLNDKMFVIYVYWLTAMSETNNLLKSPWLPYSFMEKQVLIDRLLQKKFSKFFYVTYTGDRLNIETVLPYTEIYSNAIKP